MTEKGTDMGLFDAYGYRGKRAVVVGEVIARAGRQPEGPIHGDRGQGA